MPATPATSPEQKILAAIEALRGKISRPIVVAIDGGSGAGKSTIAEKLARHTETALISLDDFYQTVIPESAWPHLPKEERLRGAFDWKRVRRDAIEPLRSGKPGRWQAFDFLRGLNPNGTYSLKDDATEVPPSPCVVVEGAYSCSPFLRDLIDLAVLVEVPTAERHRRTADRDGAEFLAGWHAIWDEVESYYFAEMCPPDSFDVIVTNW